MVDEGIFYEGTEVVHYDAIIHPDDPVDNRLAEDYTGKATYCLETLSDNFYAKGISICGRDDTFDPEFGRDKAKERADVAAKFFSEFKLAQGTLVWVVEEYAKHTNFDKKSRIIAGDDLSELEMKVLAEARSKLKAPEEMPPYEEHCGEHG